MDVAKASIAMNQSQAKQQFNVGLAKEVKDQLNQQGEAFDKLVESSQVPSHPNLGHNIDLKG
ncbi:YjfB family protein [Alkalibacillus haloalkaliphilus]|uniref:YjfB family protein n=1 Tax=Alkalibacillus haloalkaliphilus TaxID=94136 RepID=UPI002935D261|nr:YjfB family protein [Alkalibacillus haloalkaliphilus]MDV2583299.1 YjfB family protein [Alkalibacillus haloalkaliphilus]